jgi:hypothetical protein
MNQTTTPAPGQMGASTAPGMHDAMMAYADVARAMLWSVEGVRAMSGQGCSALSCCCWRSARSARL